MIKKGDNVILKFSTIWDGELCRDHGKAYIYPSMERAIQYCHPYHEVLVEYAPVKHGNWIVNNKEATCSSCKFTTFEWVEWAFNYCPNCGAKMRD